MKRSVNEKNRKRAAVIIAVLFVILISVFVRVPKFLYDGKTVIAEDQLDKYGQTYIYEMDSYYHVRIAYDIAETGSFGENDGPGGTAWDHYSFAPEGRSARYHDGLMRVTVAIWRIINSIRETELIRVIYWISLLFAALTAVAGFALGYRVSGNMLGGIATGILTASTPAFVARSSVGNFDTDMVQPLFTLIMMLAMTEVLQAKSRRAGTGWALVFGLAIALFTRCWDKGCFVFALIALAGGLICVLVMAAVKYSGTKTALTGFGASVLSMVIFISIFSGPGYFGEVLNSLSDYRQVAGGSVLPNTFVSVDELKTIKLMPDRLADALLGYKGDIEMTIVTGVGGIIVFAAAVAGLVLLLVMAATALRESRTLAAASDKGGAAESKALFCGKIAYIAVFGVWFAVGFWAMNKGIRFAEHLAQPVGVLAGMLIGSVPAIAGKIKLKNAGTVGIAAGIAVLLLITVPSVYGSAKLNGTIGYQVSDASELAMNWIAENAESRDAVIESWWDNGYYYEFESGMPVLWDGGSQDGLRAVLFGRAMITDDMYESKAMLRMLATSGNESAELLADELGYKDGMSLLYKLLTMDKEKSLRAMTDRGIEAYKAKKIEELIHPKDPCEVYLVISSRMLNITNWLEHYGNWSFGDPDKGLMEIDKDREVVKRLYTDNEGGEMVFRCYDSMDTVAVWRF